MHEASPDPAHPANVHRPDGRIDLEAFHHAYGRPPTGDELHAATRTNGSAPAAADGDRAEPRQPAETEAEGAPSARLLVRRTGDVEPEEVRPLFGGRLLLGKIAVIAGNGGIGKSYLTAALAANVSRGWLLPGDAEPFGPADVLIASYEDDTADTLRPRLDKLGADVDRVHAIEGVYDGESPTMQPFSADHIPHLSRALDDLPEARLLVIDPVTAWVGGIDEHRNNEVRGALEGLRRLAAVRDLAVVIVMHLRKATADNALHRLSGSGAYGQLVRSALLAAPDPDDESKCALAHIKHNVTARQPTLGYQVDEQGFWWLGERADLDGEQLAGHDRDDERSGRTEAEAFLSDALAAGPRPARELLAEASAAGIAERTLKRAKKRLGVRSGKAGMEGGWRWSLPEGDHEAGRRGPGHALGHLRPPSDDGGPLHEPAEEPCPRCGTPRFTAGPPDTPCRDCLTADEQETS